MSPVTGTWPVYTVLLQAAWRRCQLARAPAREEPACVPGGSVTRAPVRPADSFRALGQGRGTKGKLRCHPLRCRLLTSPGRRADEAPVAAPAEGHLPALSVWLPSRGHGAHPWARMACRPLTAHSQVDPQASP